MKPVILRAITLFGCALILMTAGCKRKYAGTSSVWAGNGDRSVNVTAEGHAFVSPQPDRLVVTLPGHGLVIEKERLLVDQKERAKVPADAKKFVVTLAAGTLTVAADGTEILKTELKK